MSELSELAEEAAAADDSVWFKDNASRIVSGLARAAELEANQSVCVCFITKPCRSCGGSGSYFADDYDDGRNGPKLECESCKGSGRKREPKCDKCVAEGKP